MAARNTRNHGFYGRQMDRNTPFFGTDTPLDRHRGAGQRLEVRRARGLNVLRDFKVMTWSRAHTQNGDLKDDKKYTPHGDPLDAEDSLKRMEPWPSKAAFYADGMLDRDLAELDEVENDNTSTETDKTHVKAERMALAYELARGRRKRYVQQFNANFVHCFREWLRGNGTDEEYEVAGMLSYTNPAQDKGKNKPISDHATVINYLTQWQDRVIEFERKRTMMKLRMGRGGANGEAASIDDLWKYYKFVVHGIEDYELDNLGPDGPDGGNRPRRGGAIPRREFRGILRRVQFGGAAEIPDGGVGLRGPALRRQHLAEDGANIGNDDVKSEYDSRQASLAQAVADQTAEFQRQADERARQAAVKESPGLIDRRYENKPADRPPLKPFAPIQPPPPQRDAYAEIRPKIAQIRIDVDKHIAEQEAPKPADDSSSSDLLNFRFQTNRDPKDPSSESSLANEHSESTAGAKGDKDSHFAVSGVPDKVVEDKAVANLQGNDPAARALADAPNAQPKGLESESSAAKVDVHTHSPNFTKKKPDDESSSKYSSDAPDQRPLMRPGIQPPSAPRQGNNGAVMRPPPKAADKPAPPKNSAVAPAPAPAMPKLTASEQAIYDRLTRGEPTPPGEIVAKPAAPAAKPTAPTITQVGNFRVKNIAAFPKAQPKMSFAAPPKQSGAVVRPPIAPVAPVAQLNKSAVPWKDVLHWDVDDVNLMKDDERNVYHYSKNAKPLYFKSRNETFTDANGVTQQVPPTPEIDRARRSRIDAVNAKVVGAHAYDDVLPGDDWSIQEQQELQEALEFKAFARQKMREQSHPVDPSWFTKGIADTKDENPLADDRKVEVAEYVERHGHNPPPGWQPPVPREKNSISWNSILDEYQALKAARNAPPPAQPVAKPQPKMQFIKPRARTPDLLAPIAGGAALTNVRPSEPIAPTGAAIQGAPQSQWANPKGDATPQYQNPRVVPPTPVVPNIVPPRHVVPPVQISDESSSVFSAINKQSPLQPDVAQAVSDEAKLEEYFNSLDDGPVDAAVQAEAHKLLGLPSPVVQPAPAVQPAVPTVAPPVVQPPAPAVQPVAPPQPFVAPPPQAVPVAGDAKLRRTLPDPAESPVIPSRVPKTTAVDRMHNVNETQARINMVNKGVADAMQLVAPAPVLQPPPAVPPPRPANERAFELTDEYRQLLAAPASQAYAPAPAKPAPPVMPETAQVVAALNAMEAQGLVDNTLPPPNAVIKPAAIKAGPRAKKPAAPAEPPVPKPRAKRAPRAKKARATRGAVPRQGPYIRQPVYKQNVELKPQAMKSAKK